MNDLLTRVYRAFDPAPLTAKERALYVDLDPVRGEGNVVNRLEQNIRLSDESTCQLLAGHRGSGKSTELRRLEDVLRTNEPRHFVVFVDGASVLDLNDVDFPEILIAMIRYLAEQLKEKAGISLKPGYFKDRLQRLKGVLATEVDLEGVELGAGLLKLSGAIKNSPDARAEVRKALDPDTSNLLQAANDLLGEAKLKLREKGYDDVVIIVDDLDKMVVRPEEEVGCSTAEYLFIHRHGQLSGFLCHTVYTMPLDLAYSSREQNISTLYGSRPPVVPMTKVREKPPQDKAYKPGMDKFREIITARLKQADAPEADVLGPGVVDRLIKLSGGQPRELMILIREALVGGGLPIGKDPVERATREGTRAYARQLTAEHMKLLTQVWKDGSLRRTKANEELIRELLDSRAVLQYINQKEWYAVNPLIPKPATSKSK
jgi:hypothetical protein